LERRLELYENGPGLKRPAVADVLVLGFDSLWDDRWEDRWDDLWEDLWDDVPDVSVD